MGRQVMYHNAVLCVLKGLQMDSMVIWKWSKITLNIDSNPTCRCIQRRHEGDNSLCTLTWGKPLPYESKQTHKEPMVQSKLACRGSLLCVNGKPSEGHFPLNQRKHVRSQWWNRNQHAGGPCFVSMENFQKAIALWFEETFQKVISFLIEGSFFRRKLIWRS